MFYLRSSGLVLAIMTAIASMCTAVALLFDHHGSDIRSQSVSEKFFFNTTTRRIHMTARFRAIIAFLYLFTAACTTTQPVTPPAKVKQVGQFKASVQHIRYVNLAEIKASLPPAPIVVGFDIDDTVLFSSPGFYYGVFNHDGPGCTNKYGNVDSLWTSQTFWNDMNGQFDKFSMPKVAGNALIQMHQQRGDTIIFITARNSSKFSITPKILAQTFSIPVPQVIFTNGKGKDTFISSCGIKVYYGDSDSDITAAHYAKARAIRVLRSPLSTNKTSYANVGGYGEEVLRNSEN